jgi:hypothetical protein
MLKFNADAVSMDPRLAKVQENNFDLSSIFNAKTDTMFCSGSVQAGFGDRFSDVDIYLLCSDNQMSKDGELSLLPSGVKFGYNIYNDDSFGYWVEFIPYSLKWVSNTIIKINNIDYHDREAISRLEYSEIDIYYRLSIGIPLINEEKYISIKDLTDISHISKIISQVYANLASSDLFIVECFMRDNNFEQAYFYAQSAIDNTIDCILASCGEAYPSGKVKFRKMEKLFGIDSNFEKEAKSLIGLGKLTYSEYCDRAVKYCQKQIAINYNQVTPSDPKYAIWGNVLLFELVDRYCLQNGVVLFKIDSGTEMILKLLQKAPMSRKNLYTHFSNFDSIKNKYAYIDSFIEVGMKYGILTIAFQ